METDLSCPQCGGSLTVYRLPEQLAFGLFCRPCKARWIFDADDWYDLYTPTLDKEKLQAVIDTTAPAKREAPPAG